MCMLYMCVVEFALFTVFSIYSNNKKETHCVPIPFQRRMNGVGVLCARIMSVFSSSHKNRDVRWTKLRLQVVPESVQSVPGSCLWGCWSCWRSGWPGWGRGWGSAGLGTTGQVPCTVCLCRKQKRKEKQHINSACWVFTMKPRPALILNVIHFTPKFGVIFNMFQGNSTQSNHNCEDVLGNRKHGGLFQWRSMLHYKHTATGEKHKWGESVAFISLRSAGSSQIVGLSTQIVQPFWQTVLG